MPAKNLINLIIKVVSYFCLQLKNLSTAEPIEFSFLGKLNIDSRIGLDYLFLNLSLRVVVGLPF